MEPVPLAVPPTLTSLALSGTHLTSYAVNEMLLLVWVISCVMRGGGAQGRASCVMRGGGAQGGQRFRESLPRPPANRFSSSFDH